MTKFDVLTVGNAIVDIISRCDDRFLNDNAITKGAMNLIDAERAELLYSLMGPALEASGGNLPARYPRAGRLFRNEAGRHVSADCPLDDLRHGRR
jgi:sugar/nucleoside kinase (ribokinase family)